MKKALILILLLLIKPVYGAMNCPENGGYEFIENGKTYCQSTTAYKNYWSAETWCDAVGGDLVGEADFVDECTGSSHHTICSYFSFTNHTYTNEGMDPFAWLSTVEYEGGSNYGMYLSDGGVISATFYGYHNRAIQDRLLIALCVE